MQHSFIPYKPISYKGFEEVVKFRKDKIYICAGGVLGKVFYSKGDSYGEAVDGFEKRVDNLFERHHFIAICLRKINR